MSIDDRVGDGYCGWRLRSPVRTVSIVELFELMEGAWSKWRRDRGGIRRPGSRGRRGWPWKGVDDQARAHVRGMPGADADIAIWEPARQRTLGIETLHMATDDTPYDGMAITGSIETVLVRGRVVIHHDKLVDATADGRRPTHSGRPNRRDPGCACVLNSPYRCKIHKETAPAACVRDVFYTTTAPR